MRSILFVLICFISLSGCALETKTLEEFYSDDLNQVSKIEIMDGNSGVIATTKDQKEIQKFIEDIKDINFIPSGDQSEKDGFAYEITFFQEGKETFLFSLNHVNGDYYYTEPDLKPIVEEFYKLMTSD